MGSCSVAASFSCKEDTKVSSLQSPSFAFIDTDRRPLKYNKSGRQSMGIGNRDLETVPVGLPVEMPMKRFRKKPPSEEGGGAAPAVTEGVKPSLQFCTDLQLILQIYPSHPCRSFWERSHAAEYSPAKREQDPPPNITRIQTNVCRSHYFSVAEKAATFPQS